MKGYLYAVTGDRFIAEAINSAKSLRKAQKGANIAIVTDKEINDDDHIFDKVIIQPSSIKTYKEGLLYKVKHIYKSSPYDETVFLDSDTYICENCEDLFEVLNFFDLALAPDPTDPNRPVHIKTSRRLKVMDVYNTGLIVFNKSQNNEDLFSRWSEIYGLKLENNEIGRENDQTSFMEALLESKSRVYTLSHAWNARTPFFITLNQSVKIIHGRHENYKAIHTKLNQPLYSKHRCWLPVHEKCLVKKSGFLYHFKAFGKKYKDRCLEVIQSLG